MHDILFIRDLHIETIIGVFEWEREVRQVITIDLELATDIQAAANSEDITEALDYWEISQRLVSFIQASEFHLLERLAEEIVQLLMQEFGVTWLRLTLGKPGALPLARTVGLIIERGSHNP